MKEKTVPLYDSPLHQSVISFVILIVETPSHVLLFATPWTVAHQAPLSMGFPRQEYWSGVPFPAPGALPTPGFKPASPPLAGGFFTTEPPGKSPDEEQSGCILLL